MTSPYEQDAIAAQEVLLDGLHELLAQYLAALKVAAERHTDEESRGDAVVDLRQPHAAVIHTRKAITVLHDEADERQREANQTERRVA